MKPDLFLRRRRGATMLELALVMPLLLLCTLGLVQFGIVTHSRNTLASLARDGARFAAIRALDDTAANVDAQVRARMRERSNATVVSLEDLPDAALAINCERRERGQVIEVVITYPMSRKLFLPSKAFGLTIVSPTYTASSMAIIEDHT